MNESIVESKRKPPYVAAGTLWEFFNKLKFVATPPHLDAKQIEEYGTPKHWAYHLLSALKFLKLVEKNGKTTPALQSLQMRGEEFKSNLEAVVRNAYAELFSKVDPARDSRANIMNFFMKHYSVSPSGSEKATTLFLDLCNEAGIPTLQEKSPSIPKAKPTFTPSGTKAKTGTSEIGDKRETKIMVTGNDLQNIYLSKLIEQISPPNTVGKDAEAIKAEAELRKAELDRIEKLLGIIKKEEEQKQ